MGASVLSMFSFRSDLNITGSVEDETFGTTARTRGGFGEKETRRILLPSSSLTRREGIHPGRRGAHIDSIISFSGRSAQERKSTGIPLIASLIRLSIPCAPSRNHSRTGETSCGGYSSTSQGISSWRGFICNTASCLLISAPATEYPEKSLSATTESSASFSSLSESWAFCSISDHTADALRSMGTASHEGTPSIRTSAQAMLPLKRRAAAKINTATAPGFQFLLVRLSVKQDTVLCPPNTRTVLRSRSE